MLKKAFINVDILIDLIYYSLFMTLHTYLLTQKKVYISLSLHGQVVDIIKKRANYTLLP